MIHQLLVKSYDARASGEKVMTAKQASKEGIPLWAMIAYCIFVALITLIAYRAISIWVGHALIVLFTLPFAVLFKLEFRRVVRFAHVIFALTLLLATVFIQFLNAPGQVETIESSAFLRFLLGDLAVRTLASIVMALLVSILLLLAPLVTLAYTSSEWLLKMRADSEITRWQAVRLFLSVIFNTNYFSCTVQDGEITSVKPAGVLPSLGGPGKVIIKPYNAAVFEKGGEITRIEGPGKILTRDGEIVKGAINLRKQWRSFRAENMLTKDNVPLNFECGVGFRIESAKDTAKRGQVSLPDHQGGKLAGIISGDYKVYRHTLYRAFYDTSSQWDTSSQATAGTQLLNIVREYLFKDLYRVQSGRLSCDQSTIAEITQEVKERTSKITPDWGVIITGFKIASVEVPAKIEKEILEMWAAQYASRSRLIEARSKRDAAKIEAAGRRDALKIEAEALPETAKAEAAATIIRGKGEAEAKAELFRQMLALDPSMDRDTLLVILDRLRSDEEIRILARLLEPKESRYISTGRHPWPLLPMGEDDEG
jgi:regulator of protease activity HflC (stomatin/prohibitin superfamily)